MQRKKAFVVGILTVSIGLVLGPSLGHCTDAGDPYSARPDTSEQVWYDETWQASGFYRLERTGASNDFHYEYIATPPATPTPTTGTNPTFIENSSLQTKETTPTPGQGYTDATSGASLPQDIVITEWRVTGHVHFLAP